MTKTTTKTTAASGFMRPLAISAALAAVIGSGPYPRTEVTKRLWAYIKAHGLQDATDKRTINPDEALAHVLGRKPVDMFAMTRLVGKHLG